MTVQLQSIPIAEDFFGPRQDTVLTWLGMAGVAINARGTVLLIDPLIASSVQEGRRVCECGRGLRIDLPVEARAVPAADAVLYTHADDDHYGPHTAEALERRLRPAFLAPPPVLDRLREIPVPSERLIRAEDFAVHAFGAVEVAVTPALHDWQETDPWQRGDCVGFIVRTPDGSIWHPGDTRLIDELRYVRNVDVLMFDVAAVRTHLGPAGSASLGRSGGASLMLVYHYGTLDVPAGSFGGCDPADALPHLQDVQAEFLTPSPGQVIRLPARSPA